MKATPGPVNTPALGGITKVSKNVSLLCACAHRSMCVPTNHQITKIEVTMYVIMQQRGMHDVFEA